MCSGVLWRKLTWDNGRLAWNGQSYPLEGVRAHGKSDGKQHVLLISGPGFEISGRATGSTVTTSRESLATVQAIASVINTAAQRPGQATPPKRPSIWASPAENAQRRAAYEQWLDSRTPR
jgi:hypothetical protein